MDPMTVLGLFAGAATVIYVMASGDLLSLLFNPLAFVLVFGGTLSATLMAYPWDIIRRIPAALALMFYRRAYSEQERNELIAQMAAMADKARRQGIESLQQDASATRDHFLSYGLQMLVEGLEKDSVRDNLQRRLVAGYQYNRKVSGVFRTMATLAPIFGLLGTLIGVVMVLRNLSDPASMGRAMASGISTTFYGIFLANFIFLPSAIKITEHNERESLHRQMALEGIIGIRDGELPMILRKRLTAFMLSAPEAPASASSPSATARAASASPQR